MSSEPAIRFQSVTKYYTIENLASWGIKNLILRMPQTFRLWRNRQRFTALDGLSFEVAKGECFGVIGRNGSGKSTTLGLVAGVLRPNDGRVVVNGRVAPLLELGAGFHHELSGSENIILNAVLLGMTRRQVEERFADIVEFAGLGEFIDQPIRTYSSGMRSRLGFAVAVNLDPDILLIDEMLAVGDHVFKQKCLEKMEEFKERGVTMLFVSHALSQVVKTCDRVAWLDHGKLVAIGDPEEVVLQYDPEALNDPDDGPSSVEAGL